MQFAIDLSPIGPWGSPRQLAELARMAEDSGWEPRHLTLWRGNRLVAAAPAYRKTDSSGEFVFDFSWAA